MGTPAEVREGSVFFTTTDDAIRGMEKIQKWIDDTECGKCPKEIQGDYDVHVTSRQASDVHFNAFSNRVQNLQWQMENLRDFVKTLPGAEAFYADIMVISDSVGWEKGEEE